MLRKTTPERTRAPLLWIDVERVVEFSLAQWTLSPCVGSGIADRYRAYGTDTNDRRLFSRPSNILVASSGNPWDPSFSTTPVMGTPANRSMISIGGRPSRTSHSNSRDTSFIEPRTLRLTVRPIRTSFIASTSAAARCGSTPSSCRSWSTAWQRFGTNDLRRSTAGSKTVSRERSLVAMTICTRPTWNGDR